MSDLQTQIANVKMLLAFLENQLPKEEVAEKPKKVTAAKKKEVDEKKPAPAKKKEAEDEKPKPEKKESDEKPAKKEKNLNRFTPAMKTELTKVLKVHDIELTEELRKEFIDHLNSLDTEEYTKVNLTSHMETFATTKSQKNVEPKKVLANVSPFAGQDDPPDMSKWTNASSYNVSLLTKNLSSDKLVEMKKTETLKPLGSGNYWHAKSGMWIFEDGDDDIDEVDFEGSKYGVNHANKRVYQLTDDKDIFVGFVGIGKFKDMKV